MKCRHCHKAIKPWAWQHVQTQRIQCDDDYDISNHRVAEPEEEMKVTTTKDFIKNTLLRLVQDHLLHCPGESCSIPLLPVAVAADLLGVPFTKEELATFL
jgi:hypothetical protein